MPGLNSSLGRWADVAPVITPAAYAAGDAIGLAVRVSAVSKADGLITRLLSISLSDVDDQNAPMRIVIYDRAPSAQTDNAAFAPTDADVKHIIYDATIAAGTDEGGADFTASFPNSGHGLPLITSAQKNLWVQFVVGATGSPTYSTATALQARMLFEQ